MPIYPALTILDEEEEEEEEKEKAFVFPREGAKGRRKEDSSIFNQLETTRTMLETELSLPTMLQAYHLVQVRWYGGFDV